MSNIEVNPCETCPKAPLLEVMSKGLSDQVKVIEDTIGPVWEATADLDTAHNELAPLMTPHEQARVDQLQQGAMDTAPGLILAAAAMIDGIAGAKENAQNIDCSTLDIVGSCPRIDTLLADSIAVSEEQKSAIDKTKANIDNI